MTGEEIKNMLNTIATTLGAMALSTTFIITWLMVQSCIPMQQ